VSSARPIAIALFVFASGCGDASETAVDAQASNIVGGTIAYDYPEAVIVNPQKPGGGWTTCSGVLLAPRVVLTAGHCVDNFVGWGVYSPFNDELGTLVYDAEVYDWSTGMVFNFEQHDVALVYLDQDFPLDDYPRIADEPLDAGAKVIAVGRTIEGVPSLDWLFESEPFPVHADSLPFANTPDHPNHYFCEPVIEKGDSGGPVFAYQPDDAAADEDGPRTIVAVNSSHQYLARVDELRDWIVERIEAHGGPTP
jgi:hypothetical protein